MDHILNKKRMLAWMRQQLIGPATETQLLEGISPLDRYPVAVLMPIDDNGQGLEVNDAVNGEGSNDNARELEPEIKRRYVPPSSVGFSFFVASREWQIQVWFSAASYQPVNNKGEINRDEGGRFKAQHFQRQALGGDEQALMLSAPGRYAVMPAQQAHPDTCRAGIDVSARPHANGAIITVSLFNKQSLSADSKAENWKVEQARKALFETELRCIIERGEVGDYPRVDYSLLDEERQELELQYQHKHVYAVGHGAAVQWHLKEKRVAEIHADFMPTVEVPQVTADVANNNNTAQLSMAYLATLHKNPHSVCASLLLFVNGYGQWLEAQQGQLLHLAGGRQAAAQRICQRIKVALARMTASVSLLRSNQQLAKAFSLANQAMLEQMLQTATNNKKNVSPESIRWRPFQLAFLLTSLQSATDQDDDFRDVVDLIWFPTGGGKTEAYLGLIALVIVWRRLRFPASSGGTTALMRYTLRLLTTQQFLRATRMICALEILRNHHPELGTEAISIGLWVGGDTSPNTFQKAHDIIDRAEQGNTQVLAKFVIERCPWCNSLFSVTNKLFKAANSPQAKSNFVVSAQSFHFCCRNPECFFGQKNDGLLPCNVVDEALYQQPPTLLMATVDKFARLAWEERTHSFFGMKGQRPPELIVQDELHLIASALGSIAGIYEAALETILVGRGIYPKYVASTATICMAKDQVQRLYGKPVAVFPPPGLSADDAYFAKTVPLSIRPGRTYIGYFAPMLNRQKNLAPLSANLLAAPELVFSPGELNRDEALEAWWTQVIYHGSLKGVGTSHNSFNINVKQFYDRLAEEQRQYYQGTGNESHEQQNHQQQSHEQQHQQLAALSKRRDLSLAQLTSVASATENALTFSRLELAKNEEGCIDAVLATNMVSVGLDVARLALMVINGQPLTTAEYIQASSRVGRSSVPGLVFVNYYRDQARSLSHYENFRAYHESFYRYVEPTSVTPFTYQARLRALHAGLVIVLRHSLPQLLANDRAGDVDPTSYPVQKMIALYCKRCGLADKERASEIEEHIHQLVEEWRSYAQLSKEKERQLCYSWPDEERTKERLLFAHDDKNKGLWPTLHSMRNVENTGLLKLI